MKAVKPVELFLTLGLVATLGACNAIAPKTVEKSENKPATPTETVKTEHSSHSEGGEGGEGGEDSSSGNADVDYVTTLSLMLGHLKVAEELIAAGNFEQAEPHIGHPVEELYGDVKDDIKERGATDFQGTLNSLHDLIKTSPKSPEVKTKLQESITAINAAVNGVGTEKLKSPEFVLQVIHGVLKVAGEEYSAAIANNKIAEIVEYQDSRGFVMQSEILYTAIADQLSPEAKKTIGAAFTELKTVWPSVEPPAAPVKTPQDVLGYIVKIEAQS